MARMKKKFKTKGKKRMGSFEAIPLNIYPAIIKQSDIKTTKAKDGEYIRLTFTITKGDFKGRKIWNNYNINNPTIEAVEIAYKELASLCDALDIDGFIDTKDFHDIPLLVRVGIKEASGKFEAQNVIKEYIPFKKGKAGKAAGKKGKAGKKDKAGKKGKKGKKSRPWEK